MQFKEVIGRIVYIKQVHLSKWSLYIQQALKMINKNVTKMTEFNLRHHYIKKGLIERQFRTLPDLPYIYEIGDYVVLKSLATSKGVKQKEHPGFKRSLGNF